MCCTAYCKHTNPIIQLPSQPTHWSPSAPQGSLSLRLHNFLDQGENNLLEKGAQVQVLQERAAIFVILSQSQVCCCTEVIQNDISRGSLSRLLSTATTLQSAFRTPPYCPLLLFPFDCSISSSTPSLPWPALRIATAQHALMSLTSNSCLTVSPSDYQNGRGRRFGSCRKRCIWLANDPAFDEDDWIG